MIRGLRRVCMLTIHVCCCLLISYHYKIILSLLQDISSELFVYVEIVCVLLIIPLLLLLVGARPPLCRPLLRRTGRFDVLG